MSYSATTCPFVHSMSKSLYYCVQMPGKAFLTFLLPYLSNQLVRMVHVPALKQGYTSKSDVYDQVRHQLCGV